MKKIFNFIDIVCKKFKKDHVNEYAAECAYFTILSFIPFLMFFLTLIKFVSLDKNVVVSIIINFIPVQMESFVIDIIEEVYEKSVGTISITVIFALWSASKGFYYLSKGLRKIYREKEDTQLSILTRFEGLFYTLIMVIAMIIFLFVLLLGTRIHNLFLEFAPSISIMTGFILKIRPLFLILMMFVICLLIYSFIPKHKQKINRQLFGAIFSAIALYLSTWFFSIYVNIFHGFSNMYGSLTTIILIMMWIYVCMYIILSGAEINTLVYRFKKIKKINTLK